MRFSIAGRQIGPDCPPYVVAEVSCNHRGSLDRAIEIVRPQKRPARTRSSCRHFVQKLTRSKLNSGQFVIEGGLWNGRSLYDLYSEAVTPWDWHAPLFEEARRSGITLFSSPGSEEAVDFLEILLAVPAYKIASFEAVDLPLIERVARTGKPAIISTGVTGRDEIAEAVAAFRGAGGRDLALLHCVSAYPAPPEDFHLKTIAELGGMFDVVAGLSDHTLGSAVAIAATALGASIIEKHVTLRRADGGLDAAFSAEPEELMQLVQGCHTAWEASGEAHFGTTRSSEPNRIFRRSIYVARDIAAGETPDRREPVRRQTRLRAAAEALARCAGTSRQPCTYARDAARLDRRDFMTRAKRLILFRRLGTTELRIARLFRPLGFEIRFLEPVGTMRSEAAVDALRNDGIVWLKASELAGIDAFAPIAAGHQLAVNIVDRFFSA